MKPQVKVKHHKMAREEKQREPRCLHFLSLSATPVIFVIVFLFTPSGDVCGD